MSKKVADWRALCLGVVGQFDHQGCTCTFPSDDCCSWAAAKSALSAPPAPVGGGAYTGAPPPHWTPDDKYDRHPKAAEGWDYRNDPTGGALAISERRLNFACDLADPRAPDQMALVHRIDLMRIMGDLHHKRAVFDLWKAERAALASPPSEGEGQADQELGSFQSPAAPSTPVELTSSSPAAEVLAALGLSEDDVPRFRGATFDPNTARILIETRTGGGNRDMYESEGRARASYPEYFEGDNPPTGPWNNDLRSVPGYLYDLDNDYDSTYAEFYFAYPAPAATSQAQSTGAQPEGRSEHKAPANPGKEEGA